MVVNFEFLGDEPIENVITAMNFQIERTIFFGYPQTIEKQRNQTEKFLKMYCGQQEVKFLPLEENNLPSTLETMKTAILQEKARENEIYFDVTGGESLALVAFGMLSTEFETPMHMYDIREDRLIELEEGAAHSISRDVPLRKTPLTLDKLVEMRGGIINYRLHKEDKNPEVGSGVADSEAIYQVAKRHWNEWNSFSQFLGTAFAIPKHELFVKKSAQTVLDHLRNNTNQLKTPLQLNTILDELATAGILTELKHTDGVYQFSYKNEFVRGCLWEGGCPLELHTYQLEKNKGNEAKVGVHLDWDGIIHEEYSADVINEIDVLSLKGNVPTFISCKSGHWSPQTALHALYELQTVTRRFGGKYARMVLTTVHNLDEPYLERAKEMGIEVRIAD